MTNCALFFTKLVPEGVPAIDKASIFAKNYIPFRDKLKEMGIVINDLYTPLAEDVYRFICDDTIHLSEEGIAKATDMVEAIIRSEAEKIAEINVEKTDNKDVADCRCSKIWRR